MTKAIYKDYVYMWGDAPDTLRNYYNAAGQKVKQVYVIREQSGGGGFSAMVPGGGEGSPSEFTGGMEVLVVPDSGGEELLGPGVGGSGPMGPGGGGGSNWTNVTSTRYYIWSGNQVVMELNSQSQVSEINIYGLGQRLARKLLINHAPDSINTYVNDFYGNVHAFVRPNGSPREHNIEYYPYGEIYTLSGTESSHFRFLGKEIDRTDEQDFGPRYYSALEGRFLAPDPILSGASPYAYTSGNPIMQYDPSGLQEAYWVDPYRMPGGAGWLQEQNSANEARNEAERQGDLYDRARGGWYDYSDNMGNVTTHSAGGTGQPPPASGTNPYDSGPILISTHTYENFSESYYSDGSVKVTTWEYEWTVSEENPPRGNERDAIEGIRLVREKTNVREEWRRDLPIPSVFGPGGSSRGPGYDRFASVEYWGKLMGKGLAAYEGVTGEYVLAYLSIGAGAVVFVVGAVSTGALIVAIPETFGASIVLIPGAASLMPAGALLIYFGGSRAIEHTKDLFNSDDSKK